MAEQRLDIEAIFFAAQQKPPHERAAYLDEACGGDTELRRRVEQYLGAQEQIGSFLESPAVQRPLAGPKDATEAETPSDECKSLSFLSPTERPDSLGRLGHYEILENIGQGGMGIVLRAFDEKLQRVVAIKVMSPELAATSPPRKRFLREARSAAQVRHEHVVDIHAVEDLPIPYLVMEYVCGETLQQKLDRLGPLEVPEVLRLGQQIARGLAAAHEKGLIHRDIKPSNILLEKGAEERVKITDFGLARAVADASLTQSGVIAGTPMYMAPEQTVGDSIDHRADLFSLGSVLYTMASGRPPFRATTSMATLKRVAEDQPRPIREIIPEVPQWLCDVIAKLHAKKPDERFQSAKEVAELLGQYLAHLENPTLVPMPRPIAPPVAPPTEEVRPGSSKGLTEIAPKVCSLPAAEGPPFEDSRRATRRHRWPIAGAILLALLGGLSLTEATGFTQLRATVIRILTPDGTLVVETNDPGVKVTIEGDGGLVITGAGLEEIRLRPGSYKVHADKGGKKLVLDRELVSISKGGREIVRVKLEVPPVAAKAAYGTFVVLAAGKERQFDTLAEAVLGASSGDTIEIRGNGPFVSEPVKLGQSALTIRAGKGFRPTLTLSDKGVQARAALLYTDGALVLEGIEFLLPGPLKNELSPWFIGCSNDSKALHIANCRFVGEAAAYVECLLSYSPTIQVRNCEFLNAGNLALWLDPGYTATCHFHNCVVAGPQTLGINYHQGSGNDTSIHLGNNTLVCGNGLDIEFGQKTAVDPAKAIKPIRVEASRNIFNGLAVMQIYPSATDDKLNQPAEAEARVKGLLGWHDRDNLYAVSSFIAWHNRPPHGPKTLTEWKKFWGKPDADAREGQWRYVGGNLAARLASAPHKLTPDDFRLRPDSAGYQAGKDRKDLGADVDLVGPGAAYEKWKKTPEYQQWLKDTGQIRVESPKEPGAFVLLGDKGTEVGKFDTLAEAVKRASSGDTIEIRGNGPFFTDAIDVGKALTVRAGAGYVPVIRPSPTAVKVDAALFEFHGTLTLEGLEIHHHGLPEKSDRGFTLRGILGGHGVPLYLTNCKLIVDNVGTASHALCCLSCARMEIRNCLIVSPHYGTGLWNVAGSQCLIDNCLIVASDALLLSPDDTNSPGTKIRLNRNHLIGRHVLSVGGPGDALAKRLREKAGPAIVPARIEFEENVVQCWRPLSLNSWTEKSPEGLPVEEQRRFLADRIQWNEGANVYESADPFLLNLHVPATGLLKGLAGLNAYWRLKDTGTVQGALRMRGNPQDLAAKSPEDITPDNFRLRPDSAGYRAGKDKKDLGADVDLVGPGLAYERWKKTPEYQQWLKDTGQIRAELPRAEPLAFVLLGGKGVEIAKFDTLAEAVKKAVRGDTIEIRGNGPFTSGPIKTDGGRVIRAGFGFRPVIKFANASGGPVEKVLDVGGPLVLEGLELHWVGNQPFKGGTHLVHSADALFVTNCSFRASSPALHACLGAPGQQRCEVRNCLFVNPPALVSLNSAGKPVVMDNCLHVGSLGLNLARTDHRLSRNTFVTIHQALHTGLPVSEEALKRETLPWGTIEAAGNVFDASTVWLFNDGAADAKEFKVGQVEALLPRVYAWAGQDNLYRARGGYAAWINGNYRPRWAGVRDLAGWKKLWKSPERGSLAGATRFAGGDLLKKLSDTPNLITTDDFRLRPDSAGYQAGKNKKDLGADVDLVGPGAAYEKWKKTPEYQQWLKDSGQSK
jgi:serine/threonine protein kinase